MSYRRLFVLALLAGLPTIVWAQFTTFLPAQTKAADSAKTAVVAQQRAQTDSIMRMRLTDMKAWVDSAAGVVPAPATASDTSSSPAATRTLPDLAATPRATVDSAAGVRKGARAPATASDLPLLALLGFIALAIGTVMLAGNQLGRDRA